MIGAARYWNPRYFAARYWAKEGAAVPPGIDGPRGSWLQSTRKQGVLAASDRKRGTWEED